MAGKVFRTAGHTGVSAGDPPILPDVQASGRTEGEAPIQLEAPAAVRTEVEAPEYLDAGTPGRSDAEDVVRLGVRAAGRINAGASSHLGAEVSGLQGIQAARHPGGEPSGRPDAKADRRSVINDAGTPGRPDAPEAETVAFSWRQTPAAAMDLDMLTLTMRARLRRGRLDKKDVLRALVVLATGDEYVQAKVAEIIGGKS